MTRDAARLIICVGFLAAAAFIVRIPSGTTAARYVRPASDSTFRQDRPALGTRLTPLPDGGGKATAETACLACHSSDIIRQQRLTKAQWTATITKMVNWGAAVPEAQRDTLLDYLATNFGPENTSFEPVVARPVGR
jgi:hypothetical protein